MLPAAGCRLPAAGYCLVLLPDSAVGTSLLLLPAVAATAAYLLLLFSSDFDVLLMPSSASLFPFLSVDAFAPVVLRFSGLLTVVVVHTPAKLALSGAQMLPHAVRKWYLYVTAVVCIRFPQNLESRRRPMLLADLARVSSAGLACLRALGRCSTN